jgi:preprotein translocase subunit SecG
MNQFNDDNNFKEDNLADLNSAINNDMENLNKSDNKDIIIRIAIVAIAILLVISIIIGIIFTQKTESQKNENKVQENILVPSIIENTENITNEKIIDDSTAYLNRKYGKVSIIWIDNNNNIIDKPQVPVLGDMQAITYKESTSSFENTTNSDRNWYDYSNKKWANAINSDGSYFVWIPRYAYKIVYYEDNKYNKKIGYSDYRGILKINDDDTLTRIYTNNSGLVEVGNHYIVEPAFMKDIASGYKNGGWNSNLSGIWVAKYEMSMETSGKHTETDNTDNGNVLTDNTIKAVSKPGVSSWRNIIINNAYLNSYNYDREKESHMIKNSEWGAIAYLSHSQYGTEETTIATNNSSKYITGGNKVVTQIYVYNGSQSTNGNATGIYDMCGGAWELIAGYTNNGYRGLVDYGGQNDTDLYGTSINTKYKNVYDHANIDKGGNDYNSTYANANYLLASGRRGEAIFETSTSGFGGNGWNSSSSFFTEQDIPFFMRGGDFNSTTGGIFSYNGVSGQTNASQTFRVVMSF